jgi:hypothetical protein
MRDGQWQFVRDVGRLALVIVAVGCGTPTGTVRLDVLSYLERAKAWAPIEAEAAATVKRIFRTQFVDESEVSRQIADSRPRIERHLVQVREYQPRSEEVERIHREYVRSWELLLAGYEAIEGGFASGDYRRLATGRERLEAWRGGIVWVADELRMLAQRLNVDPADATVSFDARPPLSGSS